MSNYDETNRGAIWGNKSKEKDTDRDFQGSINVEGVDYWISGWRRKEGEKANSPAVRFKITRKDANHEKGYEQAQQAMAPQQQAPQQAAPDVGDSFDDDIPF